VVDSLPALSYYLDQDHAIYYDRCCKRFESYSRERGTREVWSGRPLLSTPADLLAYAAPGEELWLLRDAESHGTDLTALSQVGLTEIGREVVGHDGRIELIRMRRPGAAGARREATDTTD
jgi:hypothetical protein